MPQKLIISIASDHAGFEMKNKIIDYLESNDFSLIDRGPANADSVDYPDFAKKVCNDIAEANANRGILICGSGQGMAMVANKHKGIRAALCVTNEMVELARAHNDANVLTIGARLVDESTAISFVDKFFSTPFEGDRHIERVKKIG